MSRWRRTSQHCLCSFLFSFRMCDHHICFNLQRHLIYAAPPFPPQVPVPPVTPVTSICQVSWSRLYTCHCIFSSLILMRLPFFFFFISIIQTSIKASHHLTHKALLSWHLRKTLELHVMCSDANIQRFTSIYFCCCCRCSGLHYLFISSCHANYRCRLRPNNILLSPQECPVGVLHQLLSPSSESMLNALSDFL